MNTTMKLKSLWCSIFQTPNTLMIQKSMKHVNQYDESNEYRIKREKNNESVRKSRAKNRIKLQECANHVQELKEENLQLTNKLDSLQNELFTLKGLFQHCFSFNLNQLPIKPSEIPTSTLYKIIMKNSNYPQVKQSSNIDGTSSQNSVDTTLNETDKFYINQIRNAFSVVSKSESASKRPRLDLDNTGLFVVEQDHSNMSNLSSSNSSSI